MELKSAVAINAADDALGAAAEANGRDGMFETMEKK